MLESVLGITIGGYDFAGVENDDLDETEEQRDFEIHQALLNIWSLITLPEPVTAHVFVTKRRLRGFLGGITSLHSSAWHAALQWGASKIAAYSEDDILVSRPNDDSERRNLPAGIVTSPLLSGSTLWTALRNADNNYCDDLEYDTIAPFETNAYNSNGFVQGLLNAVGATAVAIDETGNIISPASNPLSTFIGGNRPVPVNEFRSTICQ